MTRARLTRHHTERGPRWAFGDRFLTPGFELARALEVPRAELSAWLASATTDAPASGELLAPLDAVQEVWASGVTYLRSRQAREAESSSGDVYDRVYTAERPELFYKAAGFRVVGPKAPIRVRTDSRWSVPEPELALVVNTRGEIVGYTAGNDVSSRDIEGENPLYLPQAKVYDGSCALGPALQLTSADTLTALGIGLEISREGVEVFRGETSTAQIRRSFEELVHFLTREMSFPHGVLLMTGTGIIPPDDFTLRAGDLVRIRVGELELENPVQG